MQENVMRRFALFEANSEEILKKFPFEFSSLGLLAGFILADRGVSADVERIRANKQLIRQRFGAFSNVRGSLMLPIAATMSAAGDGEKYIADLARCYEAIKRTRALRSEFDVISAMSMAERADAIDPEETVDRAEYVFKKMRQNHPLLTGASDRATATVFAMDRRDPDTLLEDMEACYAILKPGFALRGDEIQAMSALLALIGMPAEDKSERARALLAALKDRNVSMNHSAYLPVVGGLTVLPGTADEIADAVREGAEALRGKRGFGFFGAGKPGRIGYSMMLMLSAGGEELQAENAMLQSVLTSVIIQEIITMIIIMTSTSAATASRSSSSNS